MLTVWGRETSINVQKVLWCCDELNLDINHTQVGGEYGGLASAGYTAINPNSRIPTIEDGDFTLWESNTIVRYLCGTYGAGALYPETIRARADAERWMDWQLCHILPGMRTLFLGLVKTPAENRNMQEIEVARSEVESFWRILDHHLAGRTFVCGDAFTIADIPLGAFIHRWYTLPIPRPDLTGLSQWYDRLCSREAYKCRVIRA